MNKPVLLDMFCGVGGAGMGYHRAGFEVIGVDIAPQPNYPFMFVQMDAIDFISEFGHKFDAFHASPPCQAHSALGKGTNDNSNEYPDFVDATRQMLKEQDGKPYIIENVLGSPLDNPLTLCGEMFGLGVIRHRLFESNVLLTAPAHVKHRGRVAGWRHGEWFEGPYFAVYGNGGGKGTLEQWRTAMGMPWPQTKLELAEAIPPAYTEFLGSQLINYCERDSWSTASESKSIPAPITGG